MFCTLSIGLKVMRLERLYIFNDFVIFIVFDDFIVINEIFL